MSDTMKVQPFKTRLDWILNEYRQNESIFGIHRSLFYKPRSNSPYAIPDLAGNYVGTPFGPAAGPHSQLLQNIICSWLSGGRFIELKTVQVMDELEIPRPCIDMEDEGYNVEWSQELKLDQSANEYIQAWAMVHILRRLLGFEQTPFDTVFNMSVGYNLEGIKSAPMTHFMDRMMDASQELAEIQRLLKAEYPQFADLEISPRVVNTVTLSTMHGCPPDEIERIARYLIEERGLNTTVKLNPTLLGKTRVLEILHHDLGYTEIDIPDKVFENDLKYDRALQLIRNLKAAAASRGVTFAVKLSNTLPLTNHRQNLPGGEMYMSGRPLYPITMNLFAKLDQEFDGDLNVSFSAGADALNVATILAAGAKPITVASDLLKPGGYSRMLQYIENIEKAMQKAGAANLAEFSSDRRKVIQRAAADALVDPRYKKAYREAGLPKVRSGLGFYDCATAPCMEQCAVCQDIPDYNRLIAQGEYDRALELILSRNPLPGITGYVCTHLCQTHCIRNDYEMPVAIRALKRFVTEHGRIQLSGQSARQQKVAIIGSGPSGLSAAFFLALNGVKATIFEAKEVPGGMVRMIPSFRLPDEIIQRDIDRITELGVDLKLSHRVAGAPEDLLREGFDAVYVASGFQKNAPLFIEGIQGEGVYSALELLEQVRNGKSVDLGHKVLVIGGGNTAMDATRVARRLSQNPVTIVYRRTRHEMPASAEEIGEALEEGNRLDELVSPVKVILDGNGHVSALECQRNRLGEPGADGRRRPEPIPGSEFQLTADSIIVAVGQVPDLAFMQGSAVQMKKDGSVTTQPATGKTAVEHVYAGGDVVGGPASIIAACADGRRAAEAVCAQFGIDFRTLPAQRTELSAEEILDIKRTRTRKVLPQTPALLSLEQRQGFSLIESGMSETAARQEANRCLQCAALCEKCVEVCPNRANWVYQISPVNWTLPRVALQAGKLAQIGTEPFVVRQTRQIVHIDDFCNECGNCATFCVHQGLPYRQKPRLFLNKADFDLEEGNAFFIQCELHERVIYRRENGRESRLTVGKEAIQFENDALKICFAPEDFRMQTWEVKQPFEGEFSTAEAAEMWLVLNGITACLPFGA